MGALEKAAKFHSDLRRACAFHEVPYPKALLTSLDLFVRGQFSRKEIIGYGLFVPGIAATMPVLISKERSLAKLGVVNDPAFQSRTEDKDEFDRICRKHGLRVPHTIGWTREGMWFDQDGRRVERKSDWGEYLAARLPAHFIIKDRAGAYGSGFRAFRREQGAFRSAGSDASYSLESLLAEIAPDTDRSGIIIQERLYDAAPLATLSGRHGLQTMRVNTLLHPDGAVSILFYMIKILAGNIESDNFSMGTTGNLIAFGDPDRGILRGAINVNACGSGMRKIVQHPETGIAFDGFPLPHWHAAVELAQAGQRAFPELPTLGWDIGLTEDGPVIIEANSRWDPPLYAPFLMSAENWRLIFG